VGTTCRYQLAEPFAHALLGGIKTELLCRYDKALALRKALASLDPKPTDEALRMAAALHKHLFQNDKLYSFFDAKFDPVIIDEAGCLQDFSPGIVITIKININSTIAIIPLFMRFFRRSSTPRTCAVCSEPKYEIGYKDEAEWKSICEPFKGLWMWDILAYPTVAIQNCEHKFDVCRVCTNDHISSILREGGCERVTCPQCDRLLTYKEVQQLATPDTFEE
jgi:hypothetical protein